MALLIFSYKVPEQAIEKQASKIIFLARDGYIYKKVYDNFFDDIPSEYALWSRIANSCATIEKDKFLFIQRNIRVKARYELKTTIESLLKLYELDSIACLCSHWQNPYTYNPPYKKPYS